MVKLLCGFSPGLFSFQNSLPSQPVPPLEDTLNRVSEALYIYTLDSY